MSEPCWQRHRAGSCGLPARPQLGNFCHLGRGGTAYDNSIRRRQHKKRGEEGGKEPTNQGQTTKWWSRLGEQSNSWDCCQEFWYN